jgi:hypothetical protein
VQNGRSNKLSAPLPSLISFRHDFVPPIAYVSSSTYLSEKPVNQALGLYSRQKSKEQNMEAALKGLSSSDVPDIEKYRPVQEDNFAFVLRALIGPVGEQGEESFDITVCTPKWLQEHYETSETVLGLHKLIVFRYDYLGLRRFIEKYLRRCSGNSWPEIAHKVGLLGQWEFENYRPAE